MRVGVKAYRTIENVWFAACRSTRVGPMIKLPAKDATESRSVHGCRLTPSLIDPHTHLMFADLETTPNGCF